VDSMFPVNVPPFVKSWEKPKQVRVRKIITGILETILKLFYS
jgi:hypothetical protein